MRKLFTFIVAFLATVSGAVWGQTYDHEIDLSKENGPFPVSDNGTYRFYNSGGVNTHGINIDPQSEATITLDGVNISVNGAAIVLDRGAQPKFILKGENVITSEDGPAIRVPRDAEGDLRTGITFVEGSTGTLTIDANGNTAIGVHNSFFDPDTGGDITINGGTIIANGTIDDGNSTDRNFTMNGNGVLVCNRNWYNHINIQNGIYCDKNSDKESDILTVHGNVTLKSPLDLTNDLVPNQLDIPNGTSLEIGAGITLKGNENTKVNAVGSFKAFDVRYAVNPQDGDPATAAVPQDYNYYGPSTEVNITSQELSCTGNINGMGAKHQFLGWYAPAPNDNIVISSSGKGTTPASYIEDENLIDFYVYNAVWADLNKKESIIINGGALTIPITFTNAPATVGIKYAISGTDELKARGLSLSQDGLSITGTPTGEAGTITQKLTVTANEVTTADDVTLRIDFTKEVPDLNNAEATLEQSTEYYYNGVVRHPLTIKVGEFELTETTHYTVEYNYTSLDGTTSIVTSVKDAGIYKVKSITGTSLVTGTFPADKLTELAEREIKVYPRTLNIDILDQTITLGDGTDEKFNSKVVRMTESTGSTVQVLPRSGDNNHDGIISTEDANDIFTSDSKLSCNYTDETLGTFDITGDAVSIKLQNSTNNTSFKANNYKVGTVTNGKLTVTRNVTTSDDVEITVEGSEKFVYNGKNHLEQPTAIKVKVKGSDGNYTELESKYYEFTWTLNSTEVSEVVNAGKYTATVTFKTPYSGTVTKDAALEVQPCPLTATIKSQTIDDPGASIETDAEGNVTIKGPVQGETPVLTGSLKVKNGLILKAGHIYKGAIVTGDGFALANGTDGNNFLTSNYELKDESITAGDLTVKQATKPTDPGDITPGDGDNDWTWDPTQNAYTMTYDGLEHGITSLKIKLTTVGTDGEKTEKYETVNITDVDYTPNIPKDFLEKGYTAEVTIPTNEYIKDDGPVTLKLMILKRDMTLDFHLPQSLTEGETPNWNAKTAITFTNLANPKGKEETPTIKDECRLVIENGKAVLKGYPYIANNTVTGFKMNNYTVDYKNNGQDITIDPDGDGDVEIPEIPVNPDEGGDGGDGQDPTKYYNIYDVTEYDFIDVSFSRNVVREGGSVNVYLGIPEGLDPAAVTLMFKRSLYGGWENLNTDDDGNYLINNIWTDIYVKAVVDESYIDPNPDENHIYIDLSETNDSIWLYTERKLVEEGKTAVIQAEVAKSCQNKEIRYMYKRTVLGEWKEMPKDYSINQYVVRDITTDIYVKAYFVFDKQDPTTAKNPHHVYADITATCEGLYLDATRHKVADEGDTKVFLYVKKGFETKDARYQFKRGLKGEWENLVPGIEQNTFQVTDIEGDIYLKGIDAIYTGTEDIDGMVRVYTKDGSLFVYTAQPEEISVVSMTGVTVKRTRQTGLQSYPLNQGIYVVRVGEQVFKVRVK